MAVFAAASNRYRIRDQHWSIAIISSLVTLGGEVVFVDYDHSAQE